MQFSFILFAVTNDLPFLKANQCLAEKVPCRIFRRNLFITMAYYTHDWSSFKDPIRINTPVQARCLITSYHILLSSENKLWGKNTMKDGNGSSLCTFFS